MEIIACPLKLSDETEILQVVVRDITFKRESELKIQALLQDLSGANEKLQRLATTDEMTGLFNFRHFKELIETEHRRSARYSGVYSIIFGDLDNFKHLKSLNRVTTSPSDLFQ